MTDRNILPILGSDSTRQLLLGPKLNCRSLELRLERLVVELEEWLVGHSCIHRNSRTAGGNPLATRGSANGVTRSGKGKELRGISPREGSWDVPSEPDIAVEERVMPHR